MWPSAQYHALLRALPKPFAFVDLDAWQANTAALTARSGKKPIRAATKSIRCLHLLETLRDEGNIGRWMCFSAEEALFLAQKGFDDLLAAYPTLQKETVAAVCRANAAGKKITLMLDHPAHIAALNAVAQSENAVLPVAVDIDVSSRFPGIYFGTHRSAVKTAADFCRILDLLDNAPFLRLAGVMTYDAQIAGVADAHRRKNALYNAAVRCLKKHSLPQIRARRAEIARILRERQIEIEFFNAGGTGSLEDAAADAQVTEVTFGSGLYQPALFDGYRSFRHRPAAGFVLEIVRRPAENIYTCLGGGYVASGSPGWDKIPELVYPPGKLTANEAAGEVQTPFIYTGRLDWPHDNFAVFRHAKAGELCERFAQLHLLQSGRLVKTVPTYRGTGLCFL